VHEYRQSCVEKVEIHGKEADHKANENEDHGSYDVNFCLRQTMRGIALSALTLTTGPSLCLPLFVNFTSLSRVGDRATWSGN